MENNFRCNKTFGKRVETDEISHCVIDTHRICFASKEMNIKCEDDFKKNRTLSDLVEEGVSNEHFLLIEHKTPNG